MVYSKNRTVTLVIPTYNNPTYLQLCLYSVARQSVFPDQIIIADDGSTQETQELVNHFENILPVQILHIWHEDQGFRKCIILNKAIAQATGTYITVVDGDFILHPDFLKDHLTMALPGRFVSGSRMMLSLNQVDRIKINHTPHVDLLTRLFTPNAYRCPVLMRMISPRYKQRDQQRTLKGGNMGIWRDDFISVNGYDEDFHGWGYEDTDLGVRLRNSGLNMINLKWGGVGYHLWHRETERTGASDNWNRLLHTISSRGTKCINGVDKYL